MLDNEIADEEPLYRGVVEANWDKINNRPSSATFKDSKGVSVDREGDRVEESDCVSQLLSTKSFYAVCKVATGDVKNCNALPLYKPIDDNIYHSEIHDSADRITMRGKKPKNIRDKATIVYKE